MIFLFPLLRGWHFEGFYQEWDTKVGSPGKVWEYEGTGLSVASAIVAKGSKDAKYCTASIIGDYPTYPRAVILSPKVVYDFGFLQANNFAPYIVRYDDTTKEYSVAFTPAYPVPYSFRLRIEIAPPAVSIEDPDNPYITIKVYAAAIVIHDKEEFKKSLKELLGEEIRAIPPIF